MKNPLRVMLEEYIRTERAGQNFIFAITCRITQGILDQLPKPIQSRFKDGPNITFRFHPMIKPCMFMEDDHFCFTALFNGISRTMKIPLSTVMILTDELNKIQFLIQHLVPTEQKASEEKKDPERKFAVIDGGKK